MSLLQRLRPAALAAPESGIVAVINHARGRDGLIPLWAGEGDLATPAFIAEAAARALREGETFYTWQRGIPELREAIAGYTERLYGRPTAPDRIFVTGSGMHAIQLVLAALAGEGDEVVFVSPLWPNFAAAAGLCGARAVDVALDWTGEDWALDLDRLRDAITPCTRAIFVNTPNNPTGWTADAATIRGILAIAREAGVFVVADEIYSRFFYGGTRAPSFHDAMGEEDALIFVNSFSKNWAMTGWRVGWIEAPAAFGQTIENLVQYSNSGVAAFMQRGAVAAIEGGEAFVAEQVARAAEARRIFTGALAATNRVSVAPPAGAFYAFFAIDGITDGMQAALRIADEALVGLAPGGAFAPTTRGHLRACFHRRLDQVEESAARLAEWIGRQP
ncbi:aminotransferase class I/II-fold pyridoxal phosphate-dependent enzyme [Aureimonas flava]|uniref:Aminotransferase n=1 Tax=Aureimonas flava TaxID=2320271 RepID=A0A3A1WQE9_9HYPH|nr:pyridoxal phosphate-dependent aminotransferase [Aureimonas flava]RIY03286.1 aminotransferase class I/II-fold pyridoxal phosphate-dependent enzyme [Aureimonas flava]